MLTPSVFRVSGPNLHRRQSVLFATAALLGLGACGGVPIRSVPALITLQRAVLSADPAMFCLAIETDARIVLSAESVPYLQLSIRPREPGGFEPLERNLPMRQTHVPVESLGLMQAPAGRVWHLYDLSTESADQLRAAQRYFMALRNDPNRKSAGTVRVGFSQTRLPPESEELADSVWRSWLRVDVNRPPIEVWSGTLRSLRDAARQAAKA